MSATKMRAGPLLIAAYVEDGQGRRLELGADTGRGYAEMMVAARTRAELAQVVATLKQLGEELPP